MAKLGNKQDVPEARAKRYLRNQQTRFSNDVLYRAVVVDNVDPDKMNRVKVLIEGLGPKYSPEKIGKWAYVMNMFGGGQESGDPYGSCFVPKIGATVYVLFEQSERAYENPVVVGGWYSGDKVPEQMFDRKEKDPKKPTPRAYGYITPKGHSILCREEDDEESIEIVSQGGRKIVLSDKKDYENISIVGAKGSEIILKEGKSGSSIRIADASGNGMVIDETTGNIAFTCKGNFMVNSKDVTFLATQTATVLGTNISLFAKETFIGLGLLSTQIGVESSRTLLEGLSVDISSITNTSIFSTIDTLIYSTVNTNITSAVNTSVTSLVNLDIATTGITTITSPIVNILGILNSLP